MKNEDTQLKKKRSYIELRMGWRRSEYSLIQRDTFYFLIYTI